MGDESDVHGMFIQWMGYQWYIYIYIYGTPPKTYADFNFTGIYSEFYIYFGTDFVPIKFEAPTVGKLKNWKTEFHEKSGVHSSPVEFSFSVFQF